MKIHFLIFLFFSTLAEAQVTDNIIPIDTSYTIYSAHKKLIEKYPFIKTVTAELSDKITITKNILYKEIKNRKLHLDIFQPNKKDTIPVAAVLLIHGGGWRSGNKLMMHPLAIKIAENGYAIFTAEYRLSGEAKYPAAVNDLIDVIKWIKNNFAEFDTDTNKIAVLGCSAGGTLAALLGVTIENKIDAVINIDGILDFTHPAESGKDNDDSKPSAGKLWFGASYKENPEIWIEASPVNYIDEKTPPFLFINSSDKRFHAGRDEAVKKLKHFSIYYEIHEIPESPHTFWLFHPWFNQTLDLINNFLNKIFR
jgi:acetyl esterase/lipase